MGELLAIFALITFSTNVMVIKAASARLDLSLGFLIAVGVNVLFASLLLGIQFLYRQEAIQWSNLGFFLFLLTGFFSTYLGRFFFFDAVVKLGPAKASTFQVSNPLFTVLLAWAFLNEDLSRGDLFAVPVMLLGLFLVSYDPRAFSARTLDPEPDGIIGAFRRIDLRALIRSGAFLALYGAAAYAVGNVLRGVAVREWNEPILGGLLGAVSGVVLHYLFSPGARRFWSRLQVEDRVGVSLFAVAGVLSISGQISVIASMWYIPVSVANLITLSTPVLVTPMSYFLLKNQENITPLTVLGIALVLSGICAVTVA